MFHKWMDTQSFHNIRKFLRTDPSGWWARKSTAIGSTTINYRGKCKLHGTNSAIQVHDNGDIKCQSRNDFITPEKDNAGFARWVMANPEPWLAVKGYVLYGEWAGCGIQKKVAISSISKKVFAIFAARSLSNMEDVIVEPQALQALIGSISDVYVLPWYEVDGKEAVVSIDWSEHDSELSKLLEPINGWVDAIEKCDPWVKENFNVEGTGEGLVFFPDVPGYEALTNLAFKAKGEKHKNISTAAPVQVNAEVAANSQAFVELTLTPARLEQGLIAMGSNDPKLTGKFIDWCVADIQKECVDELEASGLEFSDVKGGLKLKARKYFLAL